MTDKPFVAPIEAPPAEPPKGPPVVICIPSRGMTHITWTMNLIGMAIPPGTQFIIECKYPIDVSRSFLAEKAMEMGAERVFFMDDDVYVPHDALMHMMEYQDDALAETKGEKGGIVSGVYFSKWVHPQTLGFVPVPSAWKRADEDGRVRYVPLSPKELGYGPILVDAVSAGCLLIHKSVLEKLSKPWFTYNVHRHGLPEGTPDLSEDLTFCFKAQQELGVRPIVLPEVRCFHTATGLIEGSGRLTLIERWSAKPGVA